MKRSLVLLVMCGLFGSAAFGGAALAVPIEDVRAQVLKCFKVPPNAPATYSFVLRLQIIEGSVEMAMVNIATPPSPWEMEAMTAIADAATECEPYGAITINYDIPLDQNIVNQSAPKPPI